MPMASIPRRCVNLPPGTLYALWNCLIHRQIQEGPALDEFSKAFGAWLRVPHVFGTASGRSAFQLALEALGPAEGSEIIFPDFTFPVIPMVAKKLGFQPVFCEVNPRTFNAGPDEIARRISPRTKAVVATHMFGRPCPIREIVALCRERGIRVLEDCAHALGARIEGQMVGTLGDMGIFSFAEGKNMPCFGGGAMVTSDEELARRARGILQEAPIPPRGALIQKALSIWVKWFITRPAIFSLTVYPLLRLRLFLGMSLMDAAVGDELLQYESRSKLRIDRLANLQASIGLLHLPRIEGFNQGARHNASILSEGLMGLPGIFAPPPEKGPAIYVYYPLTVPPERRDELRRHLLRKGIDSKTTDMSDCSRLNFFQDHPGAFEKGSAIRKDATILEVCVYPTISEGQIRHLVETLKAWAKEHSP